MGEAKNKKKAAAAKPAVTVPGAINNGGPAFPQVGGSNGISVRAYYAAKATSAWIPALAARFQGNTEALKQVAKDAAMLGTFTADELMKAYDAK